MSKQSEKRQFERTHGYGPQDLDIRYTDGEREAKCVAKLWDFSEGGLGMDSPRSFAPGEVIWIDADLRNTAMGVQMKARARVAYCRRVEREQYRVGVAFLDISLRRIAAAS